MSICFKDDQYLFVSNKMNSFSNRKLTGREMRRLYNKINKKNSDLHQFGVIGRDIVNTNTTLHI